MSENTPDQGDQGPQSDTSGQQQPAWTPPSSQEELDRIIQSRLARERDKFADYDDLRTKAQELDEILLASQSEQERALNDAVAAAREEARTQAVAEYGNKFLDAHLSTAFRTRGVDEQRAATLLSTVNRGAFLGADGDVNTDALGAWLDIVAPSAPPAPPTPPGYPDLGGGPRGDVPPASPAEQFAAFLRNSLG